MPSLVIHIGASAPSTVIENVLSFLSSLSWARITNLEVLVFLTSNAVPFIFPFSNRKPAGNDPAWRLYVTVPDVDVATRFISCLVRS